MIARDCPQAYKLAQEMSAENAEWAVLSQDRVYENLSFRANVIAYLKACVLYVANGEKWEKSIEDFVRWSFHYDMWCKLEFFGEAIKEAMDEDKRPLYGRHRPGRRNLLELLPDEFTREKGTSSMLRQWVFRRYVTIVTNNNYQKLKFKA